MFTGTLDPASNRATWSESCQITDASTGDAIDLSAVDEITVAVRDPDDYAPRLTGTLSGGDVVIVGATTDGTFQWRFEAAQMRGLCAKSYEVGLTIEQGDDEVQIIIGRLPVLDGIVT